MQLDDLDIYKAGKTPHLVGAVFAGKGPDYEDELYLCMLPGEWVRGRIIEFDKTEQSYGRMITLDLSLEDWKTLLRQLDLMEVEILQEAADGQLAKIILRKSARQISQQVQWSVYRRDSYRCRYCGRADVPLTVDHLVLWEDGGPSIEENLVAACKRCNKKRGNMNYRDWIHSDYYRKVAKNVNPGVLYDNGALLDTLDDIPRMFHKPSHR